MRPVSHHMIPFTPSRVESIRDLRAAGLLNMVELRQSKVKTPKSGTKKGTRRKRKIVLTEATKAMLEHLDPETRAIIEAQM